MSDTPTLGVGLDVGTAFIVSARQTGGQVNFQQVRDVYLPLNHNDDIEDILNVQGTSFVVDGNRLFVIGEDAVKIANAVPGATVKRPMTSGVITKGDDEAITMMVLLLKRALGEPARIGETVCYTIPAEPLQARQQGFFNTEYHTDKLNKILRTIGFEPRPVNEATCIAYDQLRGEHKLTGFSCSFGAGMINIAHVTLGVPGLVFSLIGSGDYVDEKVADQFQITPSRAAQLKERGYKGEDGQLHPIHVVNDLGHANQQVDAICLAYERMVKNVVDNLAVQFASVRIEEPIPIVIAGGTTLITGFKQLFEETLKKVKLPFEVSAVIHPQDAFFSVARGAMYRAAAEEKKIAKKG